MTYLLNVAVSLQVFDHVTSVHGKRDCLGTREVLKEVDEVQPNGKIFKQVLF